MLLYQTVTDEDYSYAVAIRRKLHRHPELGFDLERTVACVGGELAAMGIPYTDRYGKCSLVAELNGNRGLPTLALRADMDALPIQEKTDVPFRSEIDGAMHACGHDAHTAILLAAARVLSVRRACFRAA